MATKQILAKTTISTHYKMQQTFKVIGVMTGTSLDGVDVAACTFSFVDKKWQFNIVTAKTYKYTHSIYEQLLSSHNAQGRDIAQLHAKYGIFLGKIVKQFIDETGFKAQFVANHGYTVFHEPHNGFTTQIGSGAHMANSCGLPVICDFRTADIAKGGNGAPLVPVGDMLLFSNYAACLNLGGFSNISFWKNNKRQAFDICPVNILLNYFALQAGLKFDKNGLLGQAGNVCTKTLSRLDNLDFYKKEPPKSLGREFLINNIIPCFNNNAAINDKLSTAYKHIVNQLAAVINNLPPGLILVTGGGAHNVFLIEQLQNRITNKLYIPPVTIIDFKEALIFAFLGVLRYIETDNCLATVTGAAGNSCGGAIYLP